MTAPTDKSGGFPAHCRNSSEALLFFHKLYRSYLLQDQYIKENYEILKDIYNKSPESFSVFSKKDILRIKQIQDDIKNNQFTLFSGSVNLNSDIPESLKKEKTDKKHKELCLEIIKNRNLLEKYTGTIHDLNREHPTRFGPVDIIIRNNRCIYVIEVKTKAADHSIIGQVQKYFIGISLKFILNIYDEVKIITLCPGYDETSYKGLKRINALPLILNSNPIKIKKLQLF